MISNLYQSTSLHVLFRKSQFTIFAITFVICSFTFATISMFTMETYAKQNLQLLSQTVLERIQPAVVFRDKGQLTKYWMITRLSMQSAASTSMIHKTSYWQKVPRKLPVPLCCKAY